MTHKRCFLRFILSLSQYLVYAASNGRMIGKYLERNGHVLTEVLARNLHAGTSENQENPQLGQTVPRPTFEPSTSRVQV
jgi:hypothetical protein